jgi:hypothetical protein
VDYSGSWARAPSGGGVGVSFLWPWVAWCLYVGVALVWLIPDRRIERAVAGGGEGSGVTGRVGEDSVR